MAPHSCVALGASEVRLGHAGIFGHQHDGPLVAQGDPRGHGCPSIRDALSRKLDGIDSQIAPDSRNLTRPPLPCSQAYDRATRYVPGHSIVSANAAQATGVVRDDKHGRAEPWRFRTLSSLACRVSAMDCRPAKDSVARGRFEHSALDHLLFPQRALFPDAGDCRCLKDDGIRDRLRGTSYFVCKTAIRLVHHFRANQAQKQHFSD